MDFIVNLLVDWGIPGMFIAAFLAGSFIPFSSEAVMITLIAAGVDPWGLFVWASLGNTLGGMFNYGVGRMGNEEWIYKLLKLPPKKLNKGIQQVRRYGMWAGLLSWIPILGSVITVAMGYLRLNVYYSLISMGVGKTVRYYIVMAFMMGLMDSVSELLN